MANRRAECVEAVVGFHGAAHRRTCVSSVFDHTVLVSVAVHGSRVLFAKSFSSEVQQRDVASAVRQKGGCAEVAPCPKMRVRPALGFGRNRSAPLAPSSAVFSETPRLPCCVWPSQAN